MKVHRSILVCALLLALSTLSRDSLAAPPVSFEASASWSSDEDLGVGGLAIGDANDDGLADLAVVTYSGGFPATPKETRVFLNQGATLETTPSFISSDGRWSTDVVWGRLSSSAVRPSLVVVNGGGSAAPAVIYGPDQAGAGIGVDPVWIATPPAERSGLCAAMADVNGDGHVDLFVANQCVTCASTASSGYLSSGGQLSDQASWLSSNKGQFSAAAFGDPDRSGVTVASFSATGDGNRALLWLPSMAVHAVQRVLVDGKDPGKVTVDLESGLLSFADPPAAGAAIEVLFEHTSQPDLAVSGNPGGVMIYPHQNNAIATSPTFTTLTGDGFRSLIFADIDRDGDQDLLAAGSAGSAAVLLENSGGVISETPSWKSDNASFSAQDAQVADFNGDGYPDLVMVAFADTPVVRVFVNQEGKLETKPSFTIDWGGSSVSAVTAGDIDGDGMPDSVIGYANNKVEVYRNTATPLPPPTLASVSPSEGAVGEVVTLAGDGFRAPMSVFVGDIALAKIEVVDSKQLTAEIPAALGDGTYDVAVVTGELRAATLTQAFTMAGNPSPPDAGVLGDAAPIDGGSVVDGSTVDGVAAQDGPGGDGSASESSEGCSCTTTSEPNAGSLLCLLLLAFAFRRR